jgi:DNA-binding CsgD family transcriptional regulator
LTPTELEVADIAAEGLTNQAIATRLVMSANTVKTHLSHIYAKLGVSGRSGLAAERARRSNDS